MVLGKPDGKLTLSGVKGRSEGDQISINLETIVPYQRHA